MYEKKKFSWCYKGVKEMGEGVFLLEVVKKIYLRL